MTTKAKKISHLTKIATKTTKNRSKTRLQKPTKTKQTFFSLVVVAMVAFGVLAMIGYKQAQVASASETVSSEISKNVTLDGLAIALNFDKNSKTYPANDSQNIINLVNNKIAGSLGTSVEKEDSDPIYNPKGYFTFDGKQQLISLDGSVAPKKDFTYEMWLRSEVSDEAYALASNDDKNQQSTAGIKVQDKFWWFMGYNGGNKVYLPYPDKGLDTFWHHIAITRKNDTITVFVDGLQAEVTRNINKFDLSNDSLTIGATQEDGKYKEFFKGDIAQLRVYTRALTNDEIKYNLEHTKPSFVTSDAN